MNAPASTLRAALDIVDARTDFATFARLVNPVVCGERYVDGEWLRDLCGRLLDFERRAAGKLSPRLIVEAPPQHGKSYHGIEAFAAWLLGRNPSRRIVIASYSLELARERSANVLAIIESEAYRRIFPGVELDPRTIGKAHFKTKAAGSVYAVGEGGSLTGKPADILLIDDPTKGAEEADSPTIRDKTWRWYQTVARTRLSSGGAIMAIATRWHTDDLLGRLLELTAHENWIRASYPAIAEDGCEDWREPGEALHPERRSVADLDAFRRTLTSRQWLALYQQRPVALGGEVWRRGWFRYWSAELPEETLVNGLGEVTWRRRPRSFDEVVISCDFSAGSKNGGASYTVLLVAGKSGGELFVLREARGRWSYPEARAELLKLVGTWRPRRVLVEDAAHGKALAQELETALGERLERIKPIGSKLARAHAAAAPIEQGHVFLPDPAAEAWVEAFLEELTTFPAAANDDRVDALAQLVSATLVEREPLIYFGSLGSGRAVA